MPGDFNMLSFTGPDLSLDAKKALSLDKDDVRHDVLVFTGRRLSWHLT